MRSAVYAVLLAMSFPLAGCLEQFYVPEPRRTYLEDRWFLRATNDCDNDGRGPLVEREEPGLDLSERRAGPCAALLGSREEARSTDSRHRVRVEGNLTRFLFWAETRPSLKPNETFMQLKMSIGPEPEAQHATTPQEFEVVLLNGTTRLAFDAYGPREDGASLELVLTWTPSGPGH